MRCSSDSITGARFFGQPIFERRLFVPVSDVGVTPSAVAVYTHFSRRGRHWRGEIPVRRGSGCKVSGNAQPGDGCVCVRSFEDVRAAVAARKSPILRNVTDLYACRTIRPSPGGSSALHARPVPNSTRGLEIPADAGPRIARRSEGRGHGLGSISQGRMPEQNCFECFHYFRSWRIAPVLSGFSRSATLLSPGFRQSAIGRRFAKAESARVWPRLPTRLVA